MIGEQLERHQGLHKAENAGKEIAESEKQLKGLLRQFQVHVFSRQNRLSTSLSIQCDFWVLPEPSPCSFPRPQRLTL